MIIVIGAGPAGCYYASKEKHDDVLIIEEHKTIGKPIECSGILTNTIEKFIDIPEKIVVNKIKKFKITSPDGKSIYLDLDKENIIVNRDEFDQHVASKAIENGAKIHLGEKFLGYRKQGKKYIVKTDKREYKADMIVGADGCFSSVAKAAELYGERKFIRGWQARCYYPNLEPNVTEVRIGLGEFSWITPENKKIARVGVIGDGSKQMMDDFKKLIGKAKIIEYQSGSIPLYNPKQKLRKENIFLIGDAATHVKATTYGGIIYGMIDAMYLAEDKEAYVKNVNKKLSKDLWISLKMRDFMNRMTEKQANELIKIFEKQTNKKILEQYDRNFPSKFIVQLLMKEAKLWKLGFDVFKNKGK